MPFRQSMDTDCASKLRGMELRSVRWLAERCGLPDAPLPTLASVLIAMPGSAERVISHIAWWSRHPDAGSHAERALRSLPPSNDAQRVNALLRMGYDGLIYRPADEELFVGHFFFQRHGDELHAFAGWVSEHYRGQKLLAIAAMDFLAYASGLSDVTRARVGRGGPGIPRRLLVPLQPRAAEFGWTLLPGGWIEFGRPPR